jgi:hypothetical protein
MNGRGARPKLARSIEHKGADSTATGWAIQSYADPDTIISSSNAEF